MENKREQMRKVLKIIYSEQSEEEFNKKFDSLTDEDIEKIERWIREAIENDRLS